jgi:hypothetical protein
VLDRRRNRIFPISTSLIRRSRASPASVKLGDDIFGNAADHGIALSGIAAFTDPDDDAHLSTAVTARQAVTVETSHAACLLGAQDNPSLPSFYCILLFRRALSQPRTTHRPHDAVEVKPDYDFGFNL